MKDLQIVTNVSFKELDANYDPEPNVRIYCIQHERAYNLQIRGCVPLEKNKNHKTVKRNLVATVTLTKEEIIEIYNTVINS
jgi:hypothetical protein